MLTKVCYVSYQMKQRMMNIPEQQLQQQQSKSATIATTKRTTSIVPLETSHNYDDDDHDDNTGLLSVIGRDSRQRQHSNKKELQYSITSSLLYISSAGNGNYICTSVLPKVVCLLVVATVITLYVSLVRQEQESLQYCIDNDDPIIYKDNFRNKMITCLCKNPTIPTKRDDEYKDTWISFHKKHIQDINYVAQQQQQQQYTNNNNDDAIDFVLLGDSITEHWNGTRAIGEYSVPEYRVVFDKYFNKQQYPSTATLQGMAMGISGDITTELLWRLQNGIIPLQQYPNFKPKCYVLLIGTNDIGRMSCSKTIVIAGIVEILNYIDTVYNKSIPIIVHGLLPRSDHYKIDYILGYMYDFIIYINEQLELVCTNHTNWHYVNYNALFLQPTTTTTKSNNNEIIYIINSTLMPDALHPSVEGYDLLGNVLKDTIHQYIS